MNARVKEKWLAALRSGEFTQAREYLRNRFVWGYGYCCLGVLCEVYRRETDDGEWDDGSFWTEDGSGGDTTLPIQVWRWAGLEDEHAPLPQFVVYDPMRNAADNLVMLNDFARWDFNQIADVIEQQL